MANVATIQRAALASVTFAPGVLHQIVQSCEGLLDEVPLELQADGSVEVKIVDPAHVSMLHLVLEAPRVHVEGAPRRIGLDVERVRDLLAGVPREERVVYEWFQDSETTFYARVSTLTGAAFRVRTFDPSQATVPKIPTLTLAVRAELDHTALGTVEAPGWMRLAGKVADYVRLRADGTQLDVAAGWPEDGCRMDIAAGPANGVGRSNYSLDYFQSLARAMLAWSDEFAIEFTTGHPLRLTTSDEGVRIMGLLAPRIYSEDEGHEEEF